MTAEEQLYSALVRIAAEKGIELDLNADLHIPGRNLSLDIPMQLLAASTDYLAQVHVHRLTEGQTNFREEGLK